MLTHLFVMSRVIEAGLMDEFEADGFTPRNLPRAFLFAFIIPAFAGKWVQHAITWPLWEPNAPRPRDSFRDTFPESSLVKVYDQCVAFYMAHDVPYLVNLACVVLVFHYVGAAALHRFLQSSLPQRLHNLRLEFKLRALLITLRLTIFAVIAYYRSYAAISAFCA